MMGRKIKFPVTPKGTKTCTKCLTEKGLSHFYIGIKTKYISPSCKECKAEQSSVRFRMQSPEIRTIREIKRRAYIQKNKAQNIAYHRAYYLKNKEKIRKEYSEKMKTDPVFRAKVSLRKHKRRARERNAEGTHTAEEWVALRNYYGNTCLSCGSKERITKDHIIPLVRGGKNNIFNLQPLCHSCNSKKKDSPWIFQARKHFFYFVKPPEEFYGGTIEN